MYQSFADKLLSHKHIGVFSHLRPDGDCLGSQIGLCRWLVKNGVKAEAFNEDTVSANLLWLTDYFEISKPSTEDLSAYDAFVFVDGNALHRFGTVAEEVSKLGKPLYMIDHHPDPEPIFTDSISDTAASSTCELVYLIIKTHNPQKIDEGISKALYAGLMTDTGSFQFESVRPVTMRVAADLLEKGEFRPNEVAEKIYSVRTMNQLRLMGMALETIQLHANQQIATMYVTRAMFEETGTSNEDTEGLVQYPLSIEGVKACVFFREEEDGKIKMSLRSRSEIDVNQWARKLHGGGHKKASGARFEGTMEEAIKETLKIGMEQL